MKLLPTGPRCARPTTALDTPRRSRRRAGRAAAAALAAMVLAARVLGATLAAGLVPGSAVAQPAAQPAAPPLRIGVEASYPPFSSLGPDGQLRGFDIDIANALCERLQRRCVFSITEFDALIPSLRARKIDAVVASMSVTPQRQKVVDFTRPYYQSAARLVARTDAPFDGTAGSLGGRRVGVQRNTIHDRWASERFPGATVVRYAKMDEVYLDLAAGRVDAVLDDAISIELGFLRTPPGRGFAARGPAYDDPATFGLGAGIAVRKGDAALLAALDQGLLDLRADGSYRRINDRYFGFDIWPGARRPGSNASAAPAAAPAAAPSAATPAAAAASGPLPRTTLPRQGP
jgi:arginine/ornithine transport system substrate-binding protein